MKKLYFMMFLSVIAFGFNSHAMDPEARTIVKKLKDLNGREGKVASNIEKESTGVCRITVDQDQDGISLSFEGTGYYFTPIAHIFSDVEVEDKNTLIVSTNSNRPGGDACGDFGGAVGYKKMISLKNRQVKIEETFRCTLEGFKKYKLTTTCTL